MNKYFSLSAVGMALGVTVNSAIALPVIPGASGFGMDTVAGRGGTVHKVTNLNASGSGSLKACVDASGPRVCVFEVSGTIKLTEEMKIRNPYLTIAGQTAPSPGITVRGAGLKVLETHDVLIQHLRIRVGDESGGPSAQNRDALMISGPKGPVSNVVIDHVSVSWSVDENISIWYPGVKDVTLRNVISAEGLYASIHPDGPHSKGLIMGPGTDRISVIGSLLAHNDERNFRGQGNGVAFVNNVVYNRRAKAVDIGEGSSATKYSLVGNVFIKGRDSTGNKSIEVRSNLSSGAKLFVDDNTAESWDGQNAWSAVSSSGQSYKVTTRPIWPAGLTALPRAKVVDYVLGNVGARPADRDAVDARIISDVRNGTGRLLNSQRDVGGWPTLVMNRRPLTLPNNPNGDDDKDGYTNLEEWLHGFSAAVEQVGPTAPAAPTGLTVSVK